MLEVCTKWNNIVVAYLRAFFIEDDLDIEYCSKLLNNMAFS